MCREVRLADLDSTGREAFSQREWGIVDGGTAPGKSTKKQKPKSVSKPRKAKKPVEVKPFTRSSDVFVLE